MRSVTNSAQILDLLYADHIAILIVHAAAEVVQLAARGNSEIYTNKPTARGLAQDGDKSENLMSSPSDSASSFYRRAPESGWSHSRTAWEGDDILRKGLQGSRGGRAGSGVGGGSAGYTRWSLLYKAATRIKILDFLFDKSFTYEQHFRIFINRAKCRVALLKRIAGLEWGAEVGVLRLTSDCFPANVSACQVLDSGVTT